MEKYLKKAFAEEFIEQIKKQDLTQEKIAHFSGISMRMVSLLENSKTQPTLTVIFFVFSSFIYFNVLNDKCRRK